MPHTKLGKTQQRVLEALKYHGRYLGGWVWSTPNKTASLLDSLVRRGLVEKSETGYYKIK